VVRFVRGHAPEPSQNTGGEYMPVAAEQLSWAQVVSLPYFLHVPVVWSQAPVRPQVWGMSLSQAVAQQTFITQWPEPQSMSVSQWPPFLIAGGGMASGAAAGFPGSGGGPSVESPVMAPGSGPPEAPAAPSGAPMAAAAPPPGIPELAGAAPPLPFGLAVELFFFGVDGSS
jgi:hypothetical protein